MGNNAKVVAYAKENRNIPPENRMFLLISTLELGNTFLPSYCTILMESRDFPDLIDTISVTFSSSILGYGNNSKY